MQRGDLPLKNCTRGKYQVFPDGGASENDIIIPPSRAIIKNNIGPKKVLRIGILGEPNAGKSTFVNAAVGHEISIVSDTFNTTREAVYGTFNRGNTQLVFIDTPGIVPFDVARKLKLGRVQVTAPRKIMDESDILAVMVDMTSRRKRERIHECILDLFHEHPGFPCVLLLNKIDHITKKRFLLKYASLLTQDRKQTIWGYESTGGYSGFKNVFMISASNGDGVQDVVQYFLDMAKPGEWLYDDDMKVDLPMEKQISETFRETLLNMFRHEIPWQVKQLNLICEQIDADTIRIHQKLIWPKKSQARYVLTKHDAIHSRSLKKLRHILEMYVIRTIEISSSSSLARHLL